MDFIFWEGVRFSCFIEERTRIHGNADAGEVFLFYFFLAAYLDPANGRGYQCGSLCPRRKLRGVFFLSRLTVGANRVE